MTRRARPECDAENLHRTTPTRYLFDRNGVPVGIMQSSHRRHCSNSGSLHASAPCSLHARACPWLNVFYSDCTCIHSPVGAGGGTH